MQLAFLTKLNRLPFFHHKTIKLFLIGTQIKQLFPLQRLILYLRRLQKISYQDLKLGRLEKADYNNSLELTQGHQQ